MVDSVEETEALQNENTNNEPESGKAKPSTPGNPAAQAGGSSGFGVIFPQFLEVDHHLFRP